MSSKMSKKSILEKRLKEIKSKNKNLKKLNKQYKKAVKSREPTRHKTSTSTAPVDSTDEDQMSYEETDENLSDDILTSNVDPSHSGYNSMDRSDSDPSSSSTDSDDDDYYENKHVAEKLPFVHSKPIASYGLAKENPNTKFPTFDGSFKDEKGNGIDYAERQNVARNWLSKINLLFGLYPTKEENKVVKAAVCLTGDAFAWYERQVMSDPQFNSKPWEHFCSVFKTAYFPTSDTTLHVEDFKVLNLKMDGNETVASYSQKFTKYKQALDFIESTRFETSRYLNGLTEKIKRYVMNNKPLNINEAMQYAQEGEEQLGRRDNPWLSINNLEARPIRPPPVASNRANSNVNATFNRFSPRNIPTNRSTNYRKFNGKFHRRRNGHYHGSRPQFNRNSLNNNLSNFNRTFRGYSYPNTVNTYTGNNKYNMNKVEGDKVVDSELRVIPSDEIVEKGDSFEINLLLGDSSKITDGPTLNTPFRPVILNIDEINMEKLRTLKVKIISAKNSCKAIIDTGSNVDAITTTLCDELSIREKVKLYETPITASLVKNTVDVIGEIELDIVVDLVNNPIKEKRRFLVIDSTRSILILGLPFFKSHFDKLDIHDFVNKKSEKKSIDINLVEFENRYISTIINNKKKMIVICFILMH